jgi:hypothetical protein
MNVLLFGHLGGQIGECLSKDASDIRWNVNPQRIDDDSSPMIVVADGFTPEAIRQHPLFAESKPLVLCFLTNRGLFVSSWLRPRGPCLRCFENRWLANLAFWEHSPDHEKLMKRLLSHRPGVGSFVFPLSVAMLAQQILVKRVEGNRECQICDYIDLVSCEFVPGLLLANHGCQTCDPQGADQLNPYVHSLHDVAQHLSMRSRKD